MFMAWLSLTPRSPNQPHISGELMSVAPERFAIASTSATWSSCPWVTMIASGFRLVPSLTAAGLPVKNGSIRMWWSADSSDTVAWPCQVTRITPRACLPLEPPSSAQRVEVEEVKDGVNDGKAGESQGEQVTLHGEERPAEQAEQHHGRVGQEQPALDAGQTRQLDELSAVAGEQQYRSGQPEVHDAERAEVSCQHAENREDAVVVGRFRPVAGARPCSS